MITMKELEKFHYALLQNGISIPKEMIFELPKSFVDREFYILCHAKEVKVGDTGEVFGLRYRVVADERIHITSHQFLGGEFGSFEYKFVFNKPLKSTLLIDAMQKALDDFKGETSW